MSSRPELILERKPSISLENHRKSTVRSYSKLHRDLGWILGNFSLLSRAKNLFACQEAPNGLYISFLGTPRGVPVFYQTEYSKSVSSLISDPRNFSKIMDFIGISLVFMYFREFPVLLKISVDWGAVNPFRDMMSEIESETLFEHSV